MLYIIKYPREIFPWLLKANVDCGKAVPPIRNADNSMSLSPRGGLRCWRKQRRSDRWPIRAPDGSTKKAPESSSKATKSSVELSIGGGHAGDSVSPSLRLPCWSELLQSQKSDISRRVSGSSRLESKCKNINTIVLYLWVRFERGQLFGGLNVP